MDRYPGYGSMLARVEHMKMQVKAQLPTEYSQTVDNIVDFVLDEVNQCCDVATVDATTSTDEDHPLSGGPVARADDARIDVNEHVNPASPQVDHHYEESISNEQTVSPPSVTRSTILDNIEVKVEDESNGQSVQLCEWIKKEEDEDEAQLFHCCDCGGEGCEECRVKREIKEEFDESGCETELGRNSDQVVQGCIRIKKEEDDSEGEGVRPNKMSQYVSSGQLVQHFKCVKKEEEDGGEYVMECDCEDCETCRVKMEMKEELDESGETELGGNSAQSVQGCTRVKQEKDGEVNGERPKKIQRMDQVISNVPVGSTSSNVISINIDGLDYQMSTSSTSPTIINREQIDGDNSTLNPVNIGQADDETTEQREDTSVGDERQVQVTAESFVRRIEPADELGNRFECDYRGCGRRMKHRSNLIIHIRAHTGEKHFKCSVAGCDRAFAQQSHLDVHLNAHTGSRPFVCSWPGCEARLRSNSNLTAHLRTHTGARPFICTWPDCGQAFTRSSILKTHSLVHSNERQFVCEVTGCTKIYKRKDTLRRHQKDNHN